MQKAQKLDWTEDSAKALVVIGDCEPHPPSYTDQKINWHDELNTLKAMEVKVKYDSLAYTFYSFSHFMRSILSGCAYAKLLILKLCIYMLFVFLMANICFITFHLKF